MASFIRIKFWLLPVLACLIILPACTSSGLPSTSIPPASGTALPATETRVVTPLASIPPAAPLPAATTAGAETKPSPGKPCATTDSGALVPTVAATGSSGAPGPAVTPTLLGTLDPSILSKRAGFGMADWASPEFWAAALHSGWFLSWRVLDRGPAQLPEHWQTIRVGKGCIYPSLEYLAWVAAKFPGSVWIVGNEPDVIWQDNVLPEDYAVLYHDAYQAIKTADPTARIAVGAISETTPLRLAYLERVLAEYLKRYSQPLPADWWTVHAYILREQRKSWGVDIPPGFSEDSGMLWEVSDHGREDLFEAQITQFRAWMASHGYRNTPLALTEFGILMPPDYGFPVEKVTKFMQDTFQWLQTTRDQATGFPGDGNILVQRWAWFSLSYSVYPAPNLADLKSSQLTFIGTAFKDYIQKYHP